MVAGFLVVLGLALGSFMHASVWRLREQTKKKGTFKKSELSITKGRSLCTSCGHLLAWYDLIPVISFVILKGRCRYCRKTISIRYPLAEIMVAALFLVSYLSWPYEFSGVWQWVAYGSFLGFITVAVGLALADIQWMILPTVLVYWLGFFAALFAIFNGFSAASFAPLFSAAVGSLGFGGFFYLLYQLSRGKWIGGGDVRLGFTLGLALGWQGSILGLTAATYFALLVIIVLALRGKYHRRMRLPFGPFLLAGSYLALLYGQVVIDWYLRISGLGT